jgi:hypothetical protein
MSIFSWLWNEVFSSPTAVKNIDNGAVTEHILEQSEDVEEATSMGEYALEAKESELLQDIKAEESSLAQLLSEGIIKKSDLPQLRAMAKDIRRLSDSVQSTEASIHSLLEQDSNKIQQVINLIDSELRMVSDTERRAGQIVNENLRQDILTQAGKIHALLIQERFAYTSAKGADASLQKLEARARPLNKKMNQFIHELATYIETGDRKASLKYVQLLESLNQDMEEINNARLEYLNQIIKRDDNARKWRDQINPAWAMLRELFTESAKAA